MTIASWFLVCFVLGIAFASAVFFTAAPFLAEYWRRASAVVDAAPVPTPEQIQVRHDLSAATMAEIERQRMTGIDADRIPSWVNAARRELVADPLAHEAAEGLSLVAPVIPIQRKGE